MAYYKVTFADDSPYLAHYGILGMKWGHRKDGLPQGTQGSDRSRSHFGLSDRQKKIAKGLAIGAGVAALGIGAHMTGADRAILRAVRNYRPHYGVKGLARTTAKQMRTSGKLGKAGMEGIQKSTSAIKSKVKTNARGPLHQFGRDQVLKAKTIGTSMKSYREGAAKIAARQKLDSAPRSMLSPKGRERVSSVLSSKGKQRVANVLHTPPPIPASARPSRPKITTSFGDSLPTTVSPSGKRVQKVPASVYRRAKEIDAKKAAQAAETAAVRSRMSKDPMGRAILGWGDRRAAARAGSVQPQVLSTAARDASRAKATNQSSRDAAAAFLAAQGQSKEKKKRRWL